MKGEGESRLLKDSKMKMVSTDFKKLEDILKFDAIYL